MPELTPEAVQRLRDRGLSDARISAVAAKNGYEMPKSFLQRTGEGVISGARNIGQGVRMAGQGIAELSPTKVVGGASRAAGGIAQAAASPVNEAITGTTRTLVPEGVRKGTASAIGEAAQGIASSAFGQEVAKQYAQFKQEAPGAMAGVEGVANVALNLPIVKGAASALKLGATGARAALAPAGAAGIASATKGAASKVAKKTLDWVGEPVGAEVGAKATGIKALKEAGKSTEKKVKTSFFGITKPVTVTAGKEASERARVFDGVFDKVGSDVDAATKAIRAKIMKIDESRLGSVQAGDKALSAGQQAQNVKYFTKRDGAFAEAVVAGSEKLAMGQGEATVKDLADYLMERINERVALLGPGKILEATDKGITDFIKGAKQRFGDKAFESSMTGGKSPAKQAIDNIRKNARMEVERILKSKKGLGDDYAKFANDERIAISGERDFLSRYGAKFGGDVTLETLKKSATASKLLALGVSAAFYTGTYMFLPSIFAATAALGVAGAIGYFGITNIQLRRLVSGGMKAIADKLPATTGAERIELLEQMALAGALAATLELEESSE